MWKAVITLCVFRKNLDFLTILGYILKNCFKVISPKNQYSKMTSTFLGFIFGTDFFSWLVWLTNCNCKLRAGFFLMCLWSWPRPGLLPAQAEFSNPAALSTLSFVYCPLPECRLNVLWGWCCLYIVTRSVSHYHTPVSSPSVPENKHEERKFRLE